MEQEDLFGEKGARFGDLLKLEFGQDYEEIKDLNNKNIPIGSEYLLGSNWREIVKETTKNKIKPLKTPISTPQLRSRRRNR